MSHFYNHTLAGGKWEHMMDQTHIGYTSWNEPPVNVMPKVTRIKLPEAASMGVSVEGSTLAWPGAPGRPVLPQFDVFKKQRYYVDVFNRGKSPFSFTMTASAPWIIVSQSQGKVDQEARIWISVDCSRVPLGLSGGSLNISGNTGQDVHVERRELFSLRASCHMNWRDSSKVTDMFQSKPRITPRRLMAPRFAGK